MLWLDEGGSVLEFVVIVVQRTTVIVAYGVSQLYHLELVPLCFGLFWRRCH